MSSEISAINATYRNPGVMVVDDEESIRLTMTELLSLEGFDVVAANGGRECIELLRLGFRGVILMDVMMPGMDGWSTIRAVKHEGLLEGNIVLMLTAMDTPDDRMDGLQEIVIDYITKPFDPNHLIATVQTYTGYLKTLDGE